MTVYHWNGRFNSNYWSFKKSNVYFGESFYDIKKAKKSVIILFWRTEFNFWCRKWPELSQWSVFEYTVSPTYRWNIGRNKYSNQKYYNLTRTFVCSTMGDFFRIFQKLSELFQLVHCGLFIALVEPTREIIFISYCWWSEVKVMITFYTSSNSTGIAKQL